MGVLMLVFALSYAGEMGTTALPYSSMKECEADKARVITELKALIVPSKSGIQLIATASVVPIKVEVI